MSVAAGFETGTGGRDAPGLGQVLAGVHGKTKSSGWFGAASASVFPASQPGAESFRSSWQSQLAVLAPRAGTSGLAETGTDEPATGTAAPPSGTNRIDTRTESVPLEKVGNTPVETAVSTTGSALRWMLATGPEGGSVTGAVRLTGSGSEEQTPTSPSANLADRQMASDGDAKKPGNTRPLDSAGEPAADTSMNAGRESVSGRVAPDAVQASLASASPPELPQLTWNNRRSASNEAAKSPESLQLLDSAGASAASIIKSTRREPAFEGAAPEAVPASLVSIPPPELPQVLRGSRQSASNEAAKSPGSLQLLESAGASPAGTSKSARREPASGRAAPEAVPPSLVSVPPRPPAPRSASPAASAVGAEAQPSQSVLPAALPIAVTESQFSTDSRPLQSAEKLTAVKVTGSGPYRIARESALASAPERRSSGSSPAVLSFPESGSNRSGSVAPEANELAGRIVEPAENTAPSGNVPAAPAGPHLAIGGGSTLGGNPDKADAISSVERESSAPFAVSNLASWSSRVQPQTDKSEQAPVQGENQIESQPGGHASVSAAVPVSADQAGGRIDADDAGSSPSPAALPEVGTAVWTSSRPATGPVVTRAPHQAASAPAGKYDNQAPQAEPTGLAADAIALVRDPAAASGVVNVPAVVVAGSAGAASGPRTREAYATHSAGAGSGTTGWTHAGALPAAGSSKTSDVNPDEAGAVSSVEAESSAASEQAVSSGRSPVPAIEPQPAPAQGENQNQAQLGSQTVERVPVAAFGDQAGRGSDADDADASPSSAAPPRVSKPGLAGVGRVSEQVVSRSARGAVMSDPGERGIRPLQGQSGGPAADASTLVRDPAGARGTTSAMGGNALGSPGVAAGSASHNTFTALDAGTPPGTPSWIHAGAQRAEAGFQDQSLGWVGVRADVSGGGVHATLLPGSAEAAQALGGHLAGLNAYLAEEHTPVETLTLALPGGREAGLGAGQNASQDMNQGMNQGAGQNGSPESPANPQPVMPVTATAIPVEIPVLAGRLDAAAGNPGYEGAHISVMA